MEAQLAAARNVAVESEIAERYRMEQAGIVLADRLRGQLGSTLKVQTIGQHGFTGMLSQVGSEWVVLDYGPNAVLIPASSIQSVEGMGRETRAQHSTALRRLGLASALRALSRDRSHVMVYPFTGGTRLDGVIDRVGRDFMELAIVPPGEQRRSGNVSAVVAIPFPGLAAVSSRV